MAGPGLTATLNSDGSITLTWSAPDHGSVTSYLVLLCRSKGGEETLIVYVSDMGNTATTYTDTGTDLDTRYRYHVRAKNAHVLSDVSNLARNDPVPDSSPGTLPTPPCATSTVHTGRHSSTLKNAAHQPGGCMMRRRYSRFTARLTVAGDTPKDLAARLRIDQAAPFWRGAVRHMRVAS